MEWKKFYFNMCCQKDDYDSVHSPKLQKEFGYSRSSGAVLWYNLLNGDVRKSAKVNWCKQMKSVKKFSHVTKQTKSLKKYRKAPNDNNKLVSQVAGICMLLTWSMKWQVVSRNLIDIPRWNSLAHTHKKLTYQITESSTGQQPSKLFIHLIHQMMFKWLQNISPN